jgi:hypothetical protein
MKHMARLLICLLTLAALAGAQQPAAYAPKFPGDPAQSEAEAKALGYMRTVAAAQKLYKKKHGRYASSLADLVGKGSFTKRMTKPDRGEYRVGFKGKAEGFSLTMTPRQFGAGRAFFVDQSGVIRGEAERAATAQSPPLN